MIAKETYTIDYVNTLREKYKKDPSLLERVLFLDVFRRVLINPLGSSYITVDGSPL